MEDFDQSSCREQRQIGEWGVFEAWQRQLLNEIPVGRLATIAGDGRPHLVPVCFALVGEEIAIAIDEKPKREGVRLARLRNIERDARVSLLVDRYDADWTQLAWVRVDGDATVVEQGKQWTEALDVMKARYVQYRVMQLEALPVIRVRPTSVSGWRWS